jgi:hypothetical protein
VCLRDVGECVTERTFACDLQSTRVVEYSTPEEAQNAVERLHDSELMGRKIIVSEVRHVRS